MLNREERRILSAVYARCNGGGCLVSPSDLLTDLKDKKMTAEKLDKTLKSLELDDYFDLIYSDKKGAEVMCITLKPKGRAFSREAVQNRRYLVFKIMIAVGSAILTFVVGRFLYLLFT